MVNNNFKLINESVIDQVVDAIVNPANSYMMHGGGLARQILMKAGIELNEACREYHLPINTGEVITTPSFNIKNTKMIIHAVGPDFNRKDSSLEDLYNAYYNSLIALKDNNYHSIAFPLISTGTFKGNLKNAVELSSNECIKAYNKFIKEYPNYKIEVILCAYTKEEYEKARNVLIQD